ncbi:MAG: AmmeMemoRadiSam system protein B [Syntrophales bacterium]|nr:AmmeMemoRadiSam system protein B [Syntrophales bacterium]
MDYPLLRPIEMIPFWESGRQRVLLRDPEGILEEPLVVSKETAIILLLMDGTRSLRDIQADYMRKYGELLYIEKLQELVVFLENSNLLLSERYKSYVESLRLDYERKEVRPPFLAGKSYPASPRELEEYLTGLLELDQLEQSDKLPHIRGILSPHIDYSRGGRVYGKVYSFLKGVDVDLVIILGTSHRPLRRLWAISLKDFATPLGRIAVSEEMKSLIYGSSVLKNYVDEWPHRVEHSVELQLPFLQMTLGNNFQVLPILTGGMEEFVRGDRILDDPEVAALVESFRSCLDKYGESYIVVSGADLAHIGYQFGDAFPVSESALDYSRRKDELVLDMIVRGNATGFFEVVKEEKDARRICGLSPIYFQLRLLEKCRGKVVAYEQWVNGGSSVSFAGAVFFESSG